MLLECLGKPDKRREGRDQSGSRAAVYRLFCVRRLSNYVIASYIIGKYNIASYNVKEAEGSSCVVGEGLCPIAWSLAFAVECSVDVEWWPE